jgi:hypothetical protein
VLDRELEVRDALVVVLEVEVDARARAEGFEGGGGQEEGRVRVEERVVVPVELVT